jgi:hypothetical protein
VVRSEIGVHAGLIRRRVGSMEQHGAPILMLLHSVKRRKNIRESE